MKGFTFVPVSAGEELAVLEAGIDRYAVARQATEALTKIAAATGPRYEGVWPNGRWLTRTGPGAGAVCHAREVQPPGRGRCAAGRDRCGPAMVIAVAVATVWLACGCAFCLGWWFKATPPAPVEPTGPQTSKCPSCQTLITWEWEDDE